MDKKREVKKFYTIGKQSSIILCGIQPIYSIELIPYHHTLFETFEDAEKELVEMLETTDNESFKSAWIIVPVYLTNVSECYIKKKC